ncbi:MAG: phosphodiester glycosidase family protein [Clostridia bacterium]|nr:phosphodiester glycosidase family protein [Clostridia bacterium]
MRRFFSLLCVLLLLPMFSLAESTVSPLPMDFTPGHVPDPALYTEDSYEDESMSVHMERVIVGKAQFNVARVKISDPSQLRTALAAPFGKKKTNRISTIARANNAVVAIGGDYYGNEEGGYVVRMGEVYRKKPLKSRDMLLIDEHADFHIIVRSDADELKALVEGDTKIINVFNFGPALVIDGKLQEMPEKYNYNIKGTEPRCAIGQIGPLEYLLVVVDGRGADGSKGCNVETLAQFMYDQGCVQAYNLDGGNSALMVFNRENYSAKSYEAERSVTDIIYFATAIDFGLDEAE